MRALDDSDATVAISIQAMLMLLTVVGDRHNRSEEVVEAPRHAARATGPVTLSGVAAGMSCLFG